MQFDKGYISPYFVTDAEAAETVLDDPYLLITTQKISAVADLLPLLEKVVEAGKPLVILAEDVDGEALQHARRQRHPQDVQRGRGQGPVLR